MSVHSGEEGEWLAIRNIKVQSLPEESLSERSLIVFPFLPLKLLSTVEDVLLNLAFV